jgi:hypothetical protein
MFGYSFDASPLGIIEDNPIERITNPLKSGFFICQQTEPAKLGRGILGNKKGMSEANEGYSFDASPLGIIEDNHIERITNPLKSGFFIFQ